jgi:hypothetical protein
MSDLRSTLVQILAGRAGGDPSAHLRGALMARLNQRPPGDPLRDALGQMLARNQTGARSEAANSQALLRAARDALNVLHAHHAVLAAALGACPDCWGTEPTCGQCSGSGRPGWITPDQAAFATWVVPAVRAMSESTRDWQDQKGATTP